MKNRHYGLCRRISDPRARMFSRSYGDQNSYAFRRGYNARVIKWTAVITDSLWDSQITQHTAVHFITETISGIDLPVLSV